ncbi:ABC transporter permease [Actinomycetaceae bacterium MB13-C1-2]|nr:ABC transporter permease [Actinomycetaceae bacterium MB13-C1-2]
MFEKLGAKKFAVPALMVLLIGCVMALIFYPILNMKPQELPFAIVSLDEGAETPAGDMNAGEMMVTGLTTAETPDGETAPISWELMSSQADLDAALENNDYYGALVIPADFTEKQMLAQAGQGEAPVVSVVLDNAKSPMVANQMQASIGAMLAQMDLNADVQIIHTGNSDADAASPLTNMMSQNIAVMPLMIMSMIGGIVISRILPRTTAASTSGRFANLGKQLGYAAGLSLLISLAAVILINTLVHAGAPFLVTTVFLWFASFAVMSLFLGAFDIAVPLGALAVLLVLFCGMMTAVLPAEMLPPFWANWIVPWVPQPFIAQGIRDILYMGAGLMPRGTGGLLIIGGVGLLLAIAAAFIPSRAKNTVEAVAA